MQYHSQPVIQSPLLIIGCARSGTTLLYTVLAEHPALWSIGYESRSILERRHSPAAGGWRSGALTAADLSADDRDELLRAFASAAAPGDYWRRVNALRRRLNDNPIYLALKRRGRDEGGISAGVPGAGLAVFRGLARLRNSVRPPSGPICLLEKTPENCLRLPFLQALFPDARIVHLVRDGRANVHSLLEGWRHPHHFPGYRTPEPVTSPGQTRGRWAFTLIPGWRELVDRPLEEICARQWVDCNQAVLDYAVTPGALPVHTVRYEDLIAAPAATLAALACAVELPAEGLPALSHGLPAVNAVSAPDAGKWRASADALARIAPLLAPLQAHFGYEGL